MIHVILGMLLIILVVTFKLGLDVDWDELGLGLLFLAIVFTYSLL